MKYTKIKKGIFKERPNRFIAYVDIAGKRETVHVKNTGRCGELLIPGAKVVLEDFSDRADRKTKYDLIAVYKGDRLVNMDSQAPNKVAAEYIKRIYPDAKLIKPEAKKGDSRLDFYIEPAEGVPLYMEVKGVTLEFDGVVSFPDAPTERGIKHIRELEKCIKEGFEAVVLFVIQMEDVEYFTPNDLRHKAFGDALRHGAANGVKVWAIDTTVGEDSLEPGKMVEVRL
ncbi:MAG: DNA/RNA nuclease SfsA [Ruminococcaceae bacterium]|nr:DNA/RNA nuclease SfsA [Oscillospiraceae bacterium]